jgi:penicillin amidase
MKLNSSITTSAIRQFNSLRNFRGPTFVGAPGVPARHYLGTMAIPWHYNDLLMEKIRVLIILILACTFSAAEQKADLSSAAHKALARVSGQLRMPGLEQSVSVLRDRWGVAHVYAQTQHDLFFAQGVVAAQDRLFQMELWKRAGQGRLAEILGPSALARDVNARALRYRGDMTAEYESYSPDARAILTAFTDGINAYVNSLTAPGGPGLPVEFQIAGFSPDTWHPEDCLNRMAAFSMTGNAFSELEHAQALAELGPQTAAKLFDFDPAVKFDPDLRLDLAGLSPELLQNVVGSDHRIEFPTRALQESNNWTISGALTASGKPLLANDPHRVIALPSLRYMIHLVAPGWNVIGAGEPGLPGVALGHNEHIAWGFTIFGLDQQDLYVEELNPANPLEYKTEDGWKKMEVLKEKFLIKGSAAADVELKFTRHGPVLWNDGKRALALRWVGSEAGTAGYLASLAVDRAENWRQFESAVARWKVPSENIVYADDAGNIGEHSVGLAPRRNWTGLLPVPGSGNYNWKGFIPASELPHFFNPKEGFVATANHKMIPDNYAYKVGYEWAPPYRVSRIKSVIESSKQERRKLTVADMESLQNDVMSIPALDFQKLVRSTTLKDDVALSSFLRWDGRLTRESSDAALFEVWNQQIRLALGKLFAKEYESHLQNLGGRYDDLPPDSVLRMLTHPEKDFFGNDAISGRDRFFAETLQSARSELEKLMGADMSHWSWGKLHTVNFRHGLEQQPGAKNLFDLGPLARPGDEYSVNATGMSGDSWEQGSGASYREILDTNDWDQSVAVNTPGQSGQPGSAHYSDLLSLWDTGEYFPLAYSTKAVEAATQDRLTLLP